MITKDINGNDLSANYDSVIAEPGRDWQARVLVNGTVLDCAVVSFEISKGSCGTQEEFSLGNIVSSMLTAELKDVNTNLKGNDIEIQVGLFTGEDYEWICVGKFVAIEVLKTVYSTNVTGYGFSQTKTAGTFTVPQVQSLANIASAIATATGCAVTFESGISTAPTINGSIPSGTSCYEALRILAYSCGGYVRDTNDGGIKICRFSSAANVSVSTDRMKKLPDVEEIPFEITGVKVLVSEADPEADPPLPEVSYTYGTPVVLYDENPYMSADIFNNVYKAIVGYSYKTGNIDLSLGDPRIEGDDVLSVLDVNGNTYIVPCHSVKHDFDGGLSTSVQAAKATSQSDGITYSTPITQKIDEVAQASSIAKASAEQARAYAQEAKETTDEINAYAELAGKTVTQILNDGETAGVAAQEAKEDAAEALQSSTTAYVAANSALSQLGIVEDIIGVLDLISKNGDYQLTQDTEVVQDKWYFVRAGSGTAQDPYVYSVANVATTYALTEDTEIDPTKTYYTRSGTAPDYVYTPVENPIVEDIGTYYEAFQNPSEQGLYELIGIDQSIQNYVSSHLVLTGNVLSLRTDGSDYRLDLTSNGMQIIGADGNSLATYGTDTIIGRQDKFHVKIDGAELGFYDGNTKVAYVRNNQLFIERSVVVEQMDIGYPIGQVNPSTGDIGKGQWSWKVHEVNGMNNLYLKWLG